LTEGRRTDLPRQQTLRATIDWSYSLLTEAECKLLYRLSVFSGGWTLEAAESVCTGDGVQVEEVLNLLSHLVDKSLVLVVEPDEDEPGDSRFRLLESMREYGREKLLETGTGQLLRDRHLEHYLQFAI